MLSIKRILCPTDFSEPSRHAMAIACDLARLFGAELCALHVVAVPSVPAAEYELMYPVPQDALRSAAEEQLQVVVRDVCAGGVQAKALLTSGDPGHEIVRAAKGGHYDLIVIGRQGHGMVEHLLYGSVAERVVRLADCPVLTVPPRAR